MNYVPGSRGSSALTKAAFEFSEEPHRFYFPILRHRPLRNCNVLLNRFSFTFDPLTDIPRAVVDFGPVRFLNREKLHGLLVHQADVFEVENQCTASFFFEQGPKRVNAIPCEPSTDPQNHEILSDYLALDFAGHAKRPGGILLRSQLGIGNFLANRNVLKK